VLAGALTPRTSNPDVTPTRLSLRGIVRFGNYWIHGCAPSSSGKHRPPRYVTHFAFPRKAPMQEKTRVRPEGRLFASRNERFARCPIEMHLGETRWRIFQARVRGNEKIPTIGATSCDLSSASQLHATYISPVPFRNPLLSPSYGAPWSTKHPRFLRHVSLIHVPRITFSLAISEAAEREPIGSLKSVLTTSSSQRRFPWPVIRVNFIFIQIHGCADTQVGECNAA